MEISVSRHFLSWLYDSSLSLAFTTYQTNRLFLIGLKPDGALSIFERHFDRPMGLSARDDRLLMASRWQIWELANALPEGELHNGYDRVYVPRIGHTTGELDAHDVVPDRDGRILFVNTLYSCLAAVSNEHSFTPVWQPPFISRLAPEDRCHLNGLAMADGAPAYVTAVSRSDVAAGWRERRHTGGCIIDVEDNEIVLDSLSMPHSPRLYRDRLWVANSGEGEIGWVDRAAGRFEPLAFCPGYIRGMAFHGDFAIVGLSKQRKERAFAGLALDDKLRGKDSDARCGLWIVDLRSGAVAHWLQIDGVVIELYDVATLPRVHRPMALGFQSDEIRRLLTIGFKSKPIFMALHTADPARAVVSPPPAAGGRPGDPNTPEISGPAPGALKGTATADLRTDAKTLLRGEGQGGRRAGSAPPGLGDPEYRLGNQLAKAEHFAEAIAHYEAALRAQPDHLNAMVNMGTAHHRLGDSATALDCYRRATEIDPKSVRAHANFGMILRQEGDIESAIRHYETARQLEPNNTLVLRELGSLHCDGGNWPAARRCLEAVLQIEPETAAGYNGLGAMSLLEDKPDEARPLFERALQIDPLLREAHVNLANIHEGRGEVEKARESFRRALSIRDDAVLTLHRELLCPPVLDSVEQRDDYRRRAATVIDMFASRELRLALADVPTCRAEVPFNWSYYGGNDIELRRKYAALFEPSFAIEPLGRRPSPNGPWRVGFVVTASHEGVFLRCMGGVVDRLDRRLFRPVIACTRPGVDRIRQHLRNQEANFLELPHHFERAIASLRAAQLDLIYFWEVGTDSSNYFLPFLRLAPVQCTGWGWPVSSGAPEIDYHITSEALAPPGADEFFFEPLARLPHLPAFASRLRQQPPISPPEKFGLPQGAHVYLCAQNLRKIHPDFDAALGGILRADRKGVAVFVHDKSPLLGEALQRRWRRTLPDVCHRLVVLRRLQPDDYICLVASAHVILDTPHFGGSNTAYDTFAAEVPAVTMPGAAPASRYTSALYQCMGVEETIAESVEQYIGCAVRLATDADARLDLVSRIREASQRIFESTAAIPQLETLFANKLRGLSG